MSRNRRLGRRDADRGERRLAVARGARLVALVLQDARHQFADVRFVVDDEDVGRHDYLLAISRASLFGWFNGVAGDAFGGEAQAHPGAAPAGGDVGCVEQFHASAMLLQDLADNRETEAGAFLARRHIGLEQAVAIFLRQAGAVVDHVDHDLARPRA